jgi:hypothetical protein
MVGSRKTAGRKRVMFEFVAVAADAVLGERGLAGLV